MGRFFCYHAGHLAIDPARPWQVLSSIGCVCAKLDSEEKAKLAVDALNSDNEQGILPCNLALWDKRELLG